MTCESSSRNLIYYGICGTQSPCTKEAETRSSQWYRGKTEAQSHGRYLKSGHRKTKIFLSLPRPHLLPRYTQESTVNGQSELHCGVFLLRAKVLREKFSCSGPCLIGGFAGDITVIVSSLGQDSCDLVPSSMHTPPCPAPCSNRAGGWPGLVGVRLAEAPLTLRLLVCSLQPTTSKLSTSSLGRTS